MTAPHKTLGSSRYFQLKNVDPQLRKAMKVAAAIGDMTMEDWVMFAIRKQLDRQNIVMEKEEAT